MNEIVVKKGHSVMSFVRVTEDEFSVIDERANHQSLYKTMSRKKLLGTIGEMI